MPWKCPKCGREFRNKNQWHSCVKVSVEDHLEGKPEIIREIFDKLVVKLREFGPVRIDAVKTSVNLAGRSHFGAVQIQNSCIKLGFLLDRPVEDERIILTQKIAEAFYRHVVRLCKLEEIDAQLLSWLNRAYQLRSG